MTSWYHVIFNENILINYIIENTRVSNVMLRGSIHPPPQRIKQIKFMNIFHNNRFKTVYYFYLSVTKIALCKRTQMLYIFSVDTNVNIILLLKMFLGVEMSLHNENKIFFVF